MSANTDLAALVAPGGDATVTMKRGVVTAIVAGPPASITCTINGGTTPVPGIRYPGSYTPTLGDVVEILASGAALIVHCKLA